MIEKPKMLCSYHLCKQFAIALPKADEMCFCVTHDAEFKEASKNAKSFLKFWVEAQGGSKRAARLAVRNLSNRALLEDEKVYWG